MPAAVCVQVRHQDLKAAHDQLALNLQDHKSALAAAQVGQQCLLQPGLVPLAAIVSLILFSSLPSHPSVHPSSIYDELDLSFF